MRVLIKALLMAASTTSVLGGNVVLSGAQSKIIYKGEKEAELSADELLGLKVDAAKVAALETRRENLNKALHKWVVLPTVKYYWYKITGSNSATITIPELPRTARWIRAQHFYDGTNADDHYSVHVGAKAYHGETWNGNNNPVAFGRLTSNEHVIAIRPGESDGFTEYYGIWDETTIYPIVANSFSVAISGASGGTVNVGCFHVSAYIEDEDY